MIEPDTLSYTIATLNQQWYIHLYFWVLILDLVTGVAKAVKEKKINSTIGLNGLIRHCIIALIILLISIYLPAMGLEGYALTGILFFIGQYLFSLVENLGTIGIIVPQEWIQFFQKLQLDKQFEIPIGDAKLKLDKPVDEYNKKK